MTSILVADDHEMIRQGVRSVLESKAGWTVCAEATTGQEAVDKALELKPDVVVMDFAMPGLNGLEATRLIRQAFPQTEVVILTMHDSDQLALATWDAGARAYVSKTDVGRTLVSAVEHATRHEPFLTPRLSQLLARRGADPASGPAESQRLTPRELQVLQLVGEGRSNKEVADLLGISVRTSETHRNNIMRKLNLHSVGEMVRYAIREKIVST